MAFAPVPGAQILSELPSLGQDFQEVYPQITQQAYAATNDSSASVAVVVKESVPQRGSVWSNPQQILVINW